MEPKNRPASLSRVVESNLGNFVVAQIHLTTVHNYLLVWWLFIRPAPVGTAEFRISQKNDYSAVCYTHSARAAEPLAARDEALAQAKRFSALHGGGALRTSMHS